MLIKSLIYGNNQDDNHYITVEIMKLSKKSIDINVDTSKNAVSHVKEKDLETIYDIRTGSENRWLLSGGVLLFNEQDELAVGLRDGNSVEPFSFTNIASGRCDRDVLEHCEEELESEAIIFGKKAGKWYFISIGEQSIKRITCRKLNIEKPFLKVLKECEGEMKLERFLIKNKSIKNMSNFRYYIDNVFQYEFKCFLFVDQNRKTIEYRLPRYYDFSSFEKIVIFFNEGTGYGCFKSLKALRSLIQVEKDWGESLVVPFVKEIVHKFD